VARAARGARPSAHGSALSPPRATSRAPPPQLTDEARIREVRAEATRRIKALGAQRKVKEAIQELAGLSRLGVQPDTQAATALVAACAQAGNMEMAESVFEQLFGERAAAAAAAAAAPRCTIASGRLAPAAHSWARGPQDAPPPAARAHPSLRAY
jgi:pentatricopeptide repeat protein